MSQRQLGHFPGTHHQNRFSLQVPEDLDRQLHCGGCHRNCRSANSRLGANPLGRRKCGFANANQLAADSPRPLCDFECFFDLSQNLSLAHHHRIQAGGNAKQVH